MQLVGKILSVDSRNLAEPTTTDKLPGATTLDVADGSSFDAAGGTVLVDGMPLGYLSADYDLDQLTLEVPLTVAMPTDTLVEVVPATPVRTALVDLGADGEAAPVEVPHALAALLEDGIRSPEQQEAVYVERREDGSLMLLDVTGQPAVLTSEALEAVQTSDGIAPDTSPTPTVTGGIGALGVRWTPLDNADPVHYEVHLSIDPAFVPGAGTLITDTTGSSVTVRTLPNGSPLAYDITYWLRVVAYDKDGRAEPSPSQGAKLMRVTSADIAAEYVYAGSVSAAQINGGNISADLLLSGSIKTAAAGARVELGAFGLIEYDSAGNPAVLLGTDGQASFRGQVQATTLTVTEGMSLRGTANEISRSASLTLAVGSTPSSNSPSVVVDYESFALQESSANSGSFLTLTPYSLERVGTQWVATFSDGATRLFTSTGAFVSTVGVTNTTKRSTTQLAAGEPLYFISSQGRVCRDEHRVGGVAQYQLDDPMVNLNNWTVAGTAAVDGSRIKMTTPAGSNNSTLTSAATYNMQGHDVSVDLGADAIMHATQRVALRAVIDVNNYAQVNTYVENGVPKVFVRVVKAGVGVNSVPVVYNRTTMANLVLREDEGLFYVGTRSGAGLTINYQGSVPHTFTKAQLAAMRIILEAKDVGPANVVGNSSFDTDFAGWTGEGSGNAFISRSAAQAHSGVASLLVSGTVAGDVGATATSTSSATTDAVPITVGVPYTFSWWGRMVAATARRMLVRFYWYRADGSYLSATSVDLGVNATNTAWTQGTATATAPTGAAFMAWRCYMGAINVGEQFYIDDVVITYPDLNAYADVARVRWVDSLSGNYPGLGSAIGNDGANLIVARVDAANTRLAIDTVDPGTMAVLSTVYTTTGADFTSTMQLSGVEVGTFDFAGPRIVVKPLGGGVFYVFDAAGAYQANDIFNSAPGGSAGFDWDGTAFVELGTNSRLYRHTSVVWSGARTMQWQAAFTWYDGNATGGTHETTPSPRSTFTMQKRARLTITSPDIPNLGGSDDPDRIGVYLANSIGGTLYQQLVTAPGVKNAVLTSATFSGTAAPTVNNFPGSAPGQIISPDGTLIIKGDGSVQGSSLRATAMHIGRMTKTTAQNVTVSTITTVALDVTAQLVGMTWDATNKRLVIAKAGRYFISAAVTYTATPTTAGRVECSVYINGTKTVTRTAVAATSPTGTYPGASLTVVRDLAVGDTIALATFQTAGAASTTYAVHTDPTLTYLEVAALY